MRAKQKHLGYNIFALAVIGVMLLGGCAPAQKGGEGGAGGFSTTLIFLIILVVLYFLLIRPQRKRRGEHKKLIENLQRGDKVITSSGIYGEIEYIGEQDVILKVEDGSKLRFLKDSIVRKQQSEES